MVMASSKKKIDLSGGVMDCDAVAKILAYVGVLEEQRDALLAAAMGVLCEVDRVDYGATPDNSLVALREAVRLVEGGDTVRWPMLAELDLAKRAVTASEANADQDVGKWASRLAGDVANAID